MRTSLTGIEETPISIAMNQHALSEGQRLLMKPGYDHIPEVATSPYDAFREGVIIGEFNVGRVLHKGIRTGPGDQIKKGPLERNKFPLEANRTLRGDREH